MMMMVVVQWLSRSSMMMMMVAVQWLSSSMMMMMVVARFAQYVQAFRVRRPRCSESGRVVGCRVTKERGNYRRAVPSLSSVPRRRHSHQPAHSHDHQFS